MNTKTAPSKAPKRTIRSDFDLSQASFARMTGITPDALVQWEQDKTARLDDETCARIKRVASILERFARVMRREFIPTWIEQPNAACKEIGATTPLELFERGEFESLEDMAWYLESGTPG